MSTKVSSAPGLAVSGSSVSTSSVFAVAASALLVALGACSAPPPPSPTSPTPPPSPVSPSQPEPPVVVAVPPDAEPPPDAAPAAPPPDAAPVAVASTCAVSVAIAVTGTGKTRTVIANATNTTSAPLDLLLPDRCPNGPLEFTGIVPGYDFYGTCNMGPCPVRDQRAPLRIHLEPGQTAPLATAKLELGGTTCNKPVPNGRYKVSAVIPPQAVTSCVTPAGLLVAQAVPDDTRACSSDGDCTIHCPRAPGCCGAQCGCKNAINKARVADVDRIFAATCKKERCQPVGCRLDEAHGARCDAGRCVAW